MREIQPGSGPGECAVSAGSGELIDPRSRSILLPRHWTESAGVWPNAHHFLATLHDKEYLPSDEVCCFRNLRLLRTDFQGRPVAQHFWDPVKCIGMKRVLNSWKSISCRGLYTLSNETWTWRTNRQESAGFTRVCKLPQPMQFL